ncbi:hypothetical protein GF312_01395 [Candidatus Poribacteria bacterium]|nr:hypothetical protein [Candidatus Poribacteria bacterium]
MLSFLRRQESLLYTDLLDSCLRRNDKLREFSIITTLNLEEPFYIKEFLMKQKIFVVIVVIVAVGFLIIFSQYLSKEGNKETVDNSNDLADIKTPQIDDKLTYPATITDLKGHHITLDSPPQKIIVTSSEAAFV